MLPDPEEGVVFALQVLPVIIFFASLMSVLYYLRSCRWRSGGRVLAEWVGVVRASCRCWHGGSGPSSVPGSVAGLVGPHTLAWHPQAQLSPPVPIAMWTR